jgi:ABC-type uncharacterized transport system involved in gliding motility auxiliary subunit
MNLFTQKNRFIRFLGSFSFFSCRGVAVVVAFGLGLLVTLHLTVGKSWFVDATEESLYTLSQGTRSIVSSLPEPVTVRLYYSRALGQQAPQYGVFADRILELLKTYQDLSHGKLKVSVYNPTPFSDHEEIIFGNGGHRRG